MRWSVFALAVCASFGQVTMTQQAACAATFQNYSQAWHAAQSAQRPMLVIFNQGADSSAMTEKDLRADSQINSQLDNYVVAVIDTTTESGKKDYELFAAPALPRFVVIDKQQSKQIFRTSDSLSKEKLATVLDQYKAGESSAAVDVTTNKIELPATYVQPKPGYSSCPSCQNQRYYRYSR